MCGLVGFLYNKDMEDSTLSSQLLSMTSSLSHRGPDDHGFWTNQELKIAIGHRRLSVLDLSSAGHQPMHSSSGRYIMAFNGEIHKGSLPA